jgi:hypothetical protein
MSDEERYVSNAAWVRPAGRPDAIDEVADQFERPTEDGRAAFWADEAPRWPLAPRGWRTLEYRVTAALERRAG